MSKYSIFLSKVLYWASENPDITGIAIAGSHAHGNTGPESDIDLVILTKDKEKYIKDTIWASTFGMCDKIEISLWGVLTAVRVWYSDGIEVEFGFVTPNWADIPVDSGTFRVVKDGIITLLDKDKKLEKLIKEVHKADL